jgi:Macoilin family
LLILISSFSNKIFFKIQLRKYDRNRDQCQSTDMALRSALAVMQEKNTTLEKNLSAETRVKLDLFSALGEARRQLEIRDSKFLSSVLLSALLNLEYVLDFLRTKDKQLEDLKAKTAQILAVMPNSISSVESQLNSIHLLNDVRGGVDINSHQ